MVLAFVVGAFADSMPKGRVMFITNTIKVVGCLLILFNEYLHMGALPAYWLVLLAYAVVGLGAAAYSPAKYGILTELLPPEQLVMANGWIEGLTVASIVLGTLLGGHAHRRQDLRRAARHRHAAPADRTSTRRPSRRWW